MPLGRITIVKYVINTHLAYFFFAGFFLSIKIETDCIIRHNNNCRFDISFQHISNIDSFFYLFHFFSINNTLDLIDIPKRDVFFCRFLCNKKKKQTIFGCFFFLFLFELKSQQVFNPMTTGFKELNRCFNTESKDTTNNSDSQTDSP